MVAAKRHRGQWLDGKMLLIVQYASGSGLQPLIAPA